VGSVETVISSVGIAFDPSARFAELVDGARTAEQLGFGSVYVADRPAG
jgi:alkanesulfonate monooxygenase SsuD/methylene tetrahydromethanopterin reductase-like flavin-dependent oxidoreductase (luciferase family)